MRRIEVERRTIPVLTEHIKQMPLSVVATILLKDLPKNAELYGERLPDGRIGLVIKEKTWVETYG